MTQRRRLTARRLEQHLIDHFERRAQYSARIEGARSFADDGVLTSSRGVVLRLASGQEFQITIVESRTSR